MRHKDTKKNKGGFTLVELLVVIALIGLLSTILLTSLTQARVKARDSQRVGQFRQINSALELYFNLYDHYPPVLNLPSWTGTLCSDDPTCLANSDVSWDAMVSTLEAAKVLAITPEPDSWEGKIAQLFFPKALAVGPHKIQDPTYPTRRYAYMTSAVPLNGNYRLRVQLENANHPALQAGFPGKFYWSDKSTGVDACDPNLLLYCSGPNMDFNAFDPGKPVIYLYPTHTEHVVVTVDALSIDQSIPAYGTGWSVLAHPNGQLTNLSDGKSYPYLFWEGRSGKPAIDKTQGSVVESQNIESFLTNALRKQGLSASEASEFVAYWAPRMRDMPYVYVYFMPQADYDMLIPLHVSPKPDTVIRVYMLWKGLTQPIVVTPQTFIAPKRIGFTVVEWGGDRSQVQEVPTFSP
ncbi:MAG: type II secretion system protein [bacterium]|nr:type II secretion system protein [bacterium]